jgi:hypothetical protein
MNQGNGTSTMNGTALSPSEERIVQALVRHIDERLLIQRKILEARLLAIVDERFRSLREHVDDAIRAAEDFDEAEFEDDDEDEEDPPR